MELRQLDYFIAVAEELHFGRAAERLRMTQPPLSLQVQQLERELGLTLLRRTKRSVQLTAAGEAFLRDAKAILRAIDAAVEKAQRASRGQIGELTVGFVGSATWTLLPQVIRLYREAFPDVNVALRELSTPLQVVGLTRGELDVGVLRTPVQSPELAVEVIHDEGCQVVLSATHPLSEKQTVSLDDLASESFVMLSRSIWPGLFDELMGLCHGMGFSPSIVQEATEFQTVIGLVAGGIGVSVVPASARNIHRRDVIYRSLVGPAPRVEMAVAWRQEDESPLVHAFLDVMRTAAGKASK